MKKYARISEGFIYRGIDPITDDDIVAKELNKKLEAFLAAKQVKSYRVINVETMEFDAGDKSVAIYRVCLHLEYEI